MLSKNQIKYITQLKQKKYRNQHNVFVAEGIKVVYELLESLLELVHLYSTEEWQIPFPEALFTIITESALKKISSLTTPNQCLALLTIKEPELPKIQGLKLALDDVPDPRS